MGNFIEDALQRKQSMSPQLEYMWRIQLPDISDGMDTRDFTDKLKDGVAEKTTGFWNTVSNAATLPVSVVSVFATAILDDDIAPQEEINHRVTSFDLPLPSFEIRKVEGQGVGWKAAAGKEMSTASMKIMEYEDGATLKYLTEWINRVNPDNGFHSVPAFYKKPIKLIRMSTSGLDLHVSTCVGCFPLEISNVGYSYEANGIIAYSVTFAVDTVEHEIIPYDVILRRIKDVQIEISNSATNPFSSAFDVSKHMWNILTGI